MAGSRCAFGTIVAMCSFVLAHTEDFLGSGVARIISQQVELEFDNELRSLLGHGDLASSARLQQLEVQLRPMYVALPKGADGSLDRAVARYALHRFFMQRHGWHVRGLQVAGAEKWGDAASTTMLVDSIPSYVLQLFEQRRGSRTGLSDLAMLAATLEDVVHSEAIQLLSMAYAAQGVPVEETLADDVEPRVIATYLLYYILPNPNYAGLTTKRLNQYLRLLAEPWKDTFLWVQDLQGTADHELNLSRNPFVDSVATERSFDSVVRLVEEVGEHYGQFQNLGCRGMKNDLLDLSDGSGRVLLSKFYKASMENRTQHFNESPEYLRHLGLLDETDPQKPRLILTNYLYSRNNCLASSNLYSVCCIDECEPLLASLERSIAAPLADPQRVAEVVAALSSDTVSAPRNLPVVMRRRLDEIAGRHDGNVPLHGRLFAQWMHHAFPNECPYPHTSGSLAVPLTPAEWKNSQRRVRVSTEEIDFFMEAALSSNISETFDDLIPLPWTDEEELVVAAHPMGRASLWLRLAALLLAVSSAAAGLVRMLCVGPILPASSAKAGKPFVSPVHSEQTLNSHWV